MEKNRASPSEDWSTSKARSGAITTACFWFFMSSDWKEIFIVVSDFLVMADGGLGDAGVGDVRDQVLVGREARVGEGEGGSAGEDEVLHERDRDVVEAGRGDALRPLGHVIGQGLHVRPEVQEAVRPRGHRAVLLGRGLEAG